ncbi:hypothetical protein KY346_05960 [Candidatus Woesearchaeota archaeon]|nr:hypothetical protein [Candidatus Woesearchaeota archaeon]
MVGYKRPEDDVPESQTIRKFPVLYKLGVKRRAELERLLRQYKDFLGKALIPPDIVDEVVRQSQLKTHNYHEGLHPEKKCFIVNKERSCFALVKYGNRALEYGLRIIMVHNDSPCLMVKKKPELFEWDPDLKELYTGARLDTEPYGSINPHQWVGQNVLLTGWTSRTNYTIRKLKPTPAYIPDKAIHTESDSRASDATMDEAFPHESLDVILGNESRKAMRRFLKLQVQTDKDFACSRFYVIPDNRPQILDNYYITGYGQDDTHAVFAGMKALHRANPSHTCILIGFDKEEIGSMGKEGAQGKFFDNLIEDLVYMEPRKHRTKDILQRRITRVLKNSYAMNFDGELAATHAEFGELDQNNVARLGYGPFVCAHDGAMEDEQTSPFLVRRMHNLCENPFKRKRIKIKAQFIGSPHKAGKVEGLSTMSVYLTHRGVETVRAGAPLGSMHSPAELMHFGDEYYAILLAQAFFESNQ